MSTDRDVVFPHGLRVRRATRERLRFAEEQALVLRRRANLGALEPLDPWALAPDFGIVIAGLETLEGVDPDDREHLQSVDPRVWSGGGTPLPDGRLVVLLNPCQTRERAAATIMEEVAHAHLRHKPSLEQHSNGLIGRRFDEEAEDEAYWTGTAALLPGKAVARAVWMGEAAESLARRYGVSTDLVKFHIKIRRLWPMYHTRGAS